VVELSAACQTFLSLPPASLKTVLHSALLGLRNPDQPPIFTFPISTADVKVWVCVILMSLSMVFLQQ
jgi:hypothetical protein